MIEVVFVQVPMDDGITKARVEKRLTDWRQRLEKLYAMIDAWVESTPDAQGQRFLVPQIEEPLMRRFGVPSKRLPAYVIKKGGRSIRFVPSALWIVGANGRVNISTDRQEYILVDRGGEGDAPSDWRLVEPSDRKNLKRLTQSSFRELVRNA